MCPPVPPVPPVRRVRAVEADDMDHRDREHVVVLRDRAAHEVVPTDPPMFKKHAILDGAPQGGPSSLFVLR